MPQRRIPQIPVIETAVPVELFSIFNGGLNTRDKPEELPPNESPDLCNVESTADGAIQTARGYEELGTDAGTDKVKGIMQYASGATRHAIKACGYKLQKWSGSAWSDIHSYSTASESTSVSGAMAAGALYIVDGVNSGMEKYAGGSSTANVATPAVFSFIAYLPSVDRLIGISAANKSRVYFSGVGAPETWGANDYLNVAADDGSEVTGILAALGPLLIHKGQGGRGKFTWDGLTFATTGLKPKYGTGADNPKAVCLTPYGPAHWNRQGVWLNTGSGDALLSDKITPTLRDVTAGQHAKVRLHWFDDKLWLAVPLDGSAKNSAVFYLDFSRNEDGSYRGWHKLDWAVSEFCTFEDSSGNLNLLMGSPSTSKVCRRYRQDETSSVWNKDGASMTAYWTSYVHRGKRIAKLKDYKRLLYSFDSLEPDSLPSGETTLIDLCHRADQTDSWVTQLIDIADDIDNWEDGGEWGDDGDEWPGLGKIERVIEDFYFNSRSIQLKVQKAGIDTPFTFYGIAFEEEEKESYD